MPDPSDTKTFTLGANRAWAGTLLAIGCLLSLAMAFEVDRRQRATRTERLEARGGEILAALVRGMNAPLEVLAYVPPFFQSSVYVSSEEFDTFAAPALARHSSITSVLWTPRVRHRERGDFEEAIRKRYWEDFTLKHRSAEGGLETSPPRDFYFPLLYALPITPAIRGVDVYQRDELRGAIDRAISNGEPSVSASFTLIQDPSAPLAIMVFAPVYAKDAPVGSPAERRAAIVGVTSALLRVEPLVESALQGLHLAPLELSLDDHSNESEPVSLYLSKKAKEARADPWDLSNQNPVLWTRSFEFGDRSWMASISGPKNALGRSTLPFETALLGFLLSLSVAGGMAAISSVTRLRHQIEASRQLGQYTLERRIGKGGMGTVYRARHSMLRRPTAVKVISPGAMNDRGLQRFEREVRYTSELSHPNTIAIYDYGHTPGGVFYYAMEYLEGVGLDHLVKACGPQPAARVHNILVQASGALAEAHHLGLIHRDIKPSNLMLCERGGISDMLKVLDFGLVKPMDENLDLDVSSDNTFLGTPLYMSPETISEPQKVGPAADVYALCAAGYYLLTGEPVFNGKSVVEICSRHLSDAPIPPSERRPGCSSPGLDRILLLGLAKAPSDRPADGSALLELLEALDDLGHEWTQQDAREWWSTSGTELMAERSASEETIDTDVSDHTLNVDLGHRSKS